VARLAVEHDVGADLVEPPALAAGEHADRRDDARRERREQQLERRRRGVLAAEILGLRRGWHRPSIPLRGEALAGRDHTRRSEQALR
jgi:hypothetical protein